MHYRDITGLILAEQLWHTGGITPEATLSAALSTEIRQRQAESRFERIGDGLYALRSWSSLHHSNETVDPGTLLSDDQSEPFDSIPTPPPRILSFTDAAEQVLRQSGEQKPMHYREVTD